MTTEHALGALISQVKNANGWSDQTISERAAARGHDISKSNVARIRTDPVTTIGSKQLFALEAGLGIPVRQLAQAALQSMGILDFSTSASDAEHAIAADPTLPTHIRDTLLTIIRTERLSRKAGANAPSRHSSSQQGTSSEAVEDQKNKVRRLIPHDPGSRVDIPHAPDIETLNPDDEVTEEQFATAARYIPGKSPGEVEYEQHAAAGEESQESYDEDGA